MSSSRWGACLGVALLLAPGPGEATPQAAAQGFFPLIEGTKTQTVASPIAIEGITKVTRPAPEKVGQDTKAVLKAAGYTDDQIAKLAAAKAIGVV